MHTLQIKEILQAVRAQKYTIAASGSIEGISIDSRTVKKGELFIALKGERFDAHAFIKDALARGAYAVVSARALPKNIPHIKVKNTLTALGDIARLYRSKYFIQVVGVSGSNGKSTTKEMIASLLENDFTVKRSPASFNNFVGVPLTMFTIDFKTELLIQEMETNIRGGIRRLCEIAQPLVGVITNINPTHLATLKNEYGVFKEKSELLSSLPPWGIAVLNADDAYYRRLCKAAGKRRIISFGIKRKCDFKASKIVHGRKSISFIVNGKYRVNLSTVFHKNVYNALGAFAVSCGVFGISPAKACSLLRKFQGLPMRSQVVHKRGCIIINDCFNANPQSMKDALAAFVSGKGKRKLAVLGDMYELGVSEKKLHAEVGRFCARLKLSRLVCVGNLSRFTARAAQKNGMTHAKITYCKTKALAVKLLNSELRKGDSVLVKGSRSMQLEKIVKQL